MKSRLHAAIASAFVAAWAVEGFGRPDLLAYEGFDVGPRPDLAGAAGGTGWTSPWQDVGSGLLTSVGATGLGYFTLPTLPGAAVTQPGSLPDLTDYYRSFGAVVSPDNRLYMSFLLRPDAGYGSFAGLEFGMWPRAVHFGTPLGYYVYGMMVGDGLIAPTNVPVVQGQTAFLVLEIRLVPATSHGVYSLYVNPDARGVQPAFPSVQASLPGISALPTGVHIKGDGGYTTDEIRIGLTWASVVGGVACYPDCNADGVLTVADFGCFQTGFVAGSPTADCNGDMLLTVADFGCFQTAFVAGCP